MLEPLFCYNEYQKGGVFYDDEKYCPDNGRPSMDTVMLIKIPFIQYLYGIKKHASDHERDRGKRCPLVFRTTDMLDPVPHFSTFGKNYTRRFKDTDLFEQIFSKILEKRGWNTARFFVDFEENKKKRSFKEKWCWP